MESLLGTISAAMIIASATSMTGGVTAGPGETVVTGSSYSSVQVTNVINAGNGGGKYTTVIETNTDGEKHTEVIEKVIPPGEGIVEVIVATSSSTGGNVDVKTKAEASIIGSSTLTPSVILATKNFTLQIVERISSFFGSFWGFFSFR